MDALKGAVETVSVTVPRSHAQNYASARVRAQDECCMPMLDFLYIFYTATYLTILISLRFSNRKRLFIISSAMFERWT